jgi:carboxylesterase
VPVLPGAEPFSHDPENSGGDGDIGVLVSHGFTGSPQSMRPWAEHLAAQGFAVRLPRLPGHGTSWQELNRTRFEDWYAAIDGAFMELAGRCSKVVVAGLSMGGTLVTRLAEQRGTEIAGVMLVNPVFRAEDPRLAALPVIKHLVPSLPAIGNDIRKEGVTELAYSRTPLKALHSLVQAWGPVVHDLPQVTQPMLLMRSAVDHVVPASSSALLLSRISSKDVTEIILDNSYHVATLDNDAEQIFSASTDFVRRVCA